MGSTALCWVLAGHPVVAAVFGAVAVVSGAINLRAEQQA